MVHGMTIQRAEFSCEITREDGAPDNVFTFVASSETVNRDGIIVVQNWDLEHFLENPVILFQHDHERVIGRALSARVDEQRRLIITLELDDDPKNPDGQRAAHLVRKGFMKQGSVGFRPGSVALRKNFPAESPYYAENDDDGYAPVFGADSPNRLHEFSLVAVGADPSAMRIRSTADRDMLKAQLLDLIENDVDVIRAIHSKRQPVDELERMLATETPDELEAILNS